MRSLVPIATLLLGACATGGTSPEPKAAVDTRTALPYGTWPSAIAAEQLARAAVTMSDLRVDRGRVFWRESRPDQAGRQVLMVRERDGTVHELTPAGFSVRTRVHEYGGSSYVVLGDDLVFSNFADQRLYLQRYGGAPQALTPPDYRYADCVFDGPRQRLICVREDHTEATRKTNGEERNEIVALPLPAPGVAPSGDIAGEVLISGWDFVAYPRLSPDGSQLAYIAWAHPHMPWDRAALLVANLTASGIGAIQPVVQADGRSATEPVWSEDGTLHYIDDPGGWWNLYRWRGGQASGVSNMAREFGGPLWQHGSASYVIFPGGGIVARSSLNGTDQLSVIAETTDPHPLRLPFVAFGEIARLDDSRLVALAMSNTDEPALIELAGNMDDFELLYQPARSTLERDWISIAEPIEFLTRPGADGKERSAHAFFYPPRNPQARGPDGGKPPLLVFVHGGPTSVAKASFSLQRQFWTSRGFAIVDVNYGGSTTFGRAYRTRLNGQWGVVDVADAVAAAEHLVQTGRVDRERVAIRGGSAGGFTTLAALAFTDYFKAGANYFGVSDIKALAATSHKFERLYDVSLVGPPNEALYRARSPLFHLESFREPLITFQGAEDRIVPPEQSRMIFAALKANGVPTAYLEFTGEQHGFRQAPNIIRAAEAELYFYGRIFGFTPADTIKPVEIFNLPAPPTPAPN